MKTSTSEFSFFKAGQGSFYGGRIGDENCKKVCTIVYDCGTTTYIAGNSKSLNDEITDFKNRIGVSPEKEDIDILFISHLDYDHVSGLGRLFEEFNVKRIVLPYIEKEKRKIFLASLSFIGEALSSDDLSTADYTAFIESPHEFIHTKSDETVIFIINPNDRIGGYIPIEYDGPDNIYPIGTSLMKDKIPELKDTEEYVHLYDNNLQFFYRKEWEFSTYVKDISDSGIEGFIECLRGKLGRKRKTIDLKDLKDITTEKRKDIHGCYKKYIGEINSHGLVLVHGPIGFKEACVGAFSNSNLNRKGCFSVLPHDVFGKFKYLNTLLFGDTSINPSNNPVQFPMDFKEKIKKSHIFQVPHHGSSKNWDLGEFRMLSVGSDIGSQNNVIPVCNFGYGNKYGHPSHEVLNDLSSAIYLNSQFSRLTILSKIIY